MYFDALYSDPHFYHRNIIKYCNRPFDDEVHMNTEMIKRYNDKVRSGDTTLFLGDCFFTKDLKAMKYIMEQLNGRKLLLRGNHDDRVTDKQFLDIGFDYVFGESFIGKIDNYTVRFSHYPYFDSELDKRYADRRPKPETDTFLIHGHTHSNLRTNINNQIHVGVDAWNYGPALHDEVLEVIDDYVANHLRG